MCLVAAAARAAEPANGGEKKLKFIFITTCVDEDFFKPVKKGMADAARMMGVECVFTGTPGVDVKAQAEMVRQALSDGYDGIALNIIDPVAFDGVVEEARNRGVPLVAFNVDDYATPNARLSAVCQRYYDAGRTVGRRCAEYIPAGSHILMTQHAAGVSALDDRLRGEQEELGKKGITWTAVVTGNTAAESAEVITRELKKNPQLKFVVCTGQADTEGAGLAIEKHFRERGVVAAGFDLTPEILRLIKAGIIRFTDRPAAVHPRLLPGRAADVVQTLRHHAREHGRRGGGDHAGSSRQRAEADRTAVPVTPKMVFRRIRLASMVSRLVWHGLLVGRVRADTANK